MKRLLNSSWDHAVSLLQEVRVWITSSGLSSPRIAGEGSVLGQVCFDIFNIKTIWVVDGRIVLNDCGNLSSVLLNEFGGPVADSSETLDNESLVFDSSGETALVSERLCVEELTDGIVDSKSSGLVSSGNSSLVDELTSAASLGVDVLLSLYVLIRIFDPGHGLLVSSHVWSKAVDSSTDESFLDKFHSVFTGNSLNLGLRVVPWIDLDSSLGSTEWNISDSQFEGHQGSKSLNLLQVNVAGISGSTLDWQLVGRVLGSMKNKID